LEFLQRNILMATSWAQEVITYDLCVKPTGNSNKKIQLQVFPECELHLNQKCEVHCQKCDVPVCLKCMLGSHNGHSIQDIPENFNDKKKEIEKETQEIESTLIPIKLNILKTNRVSEVTNYKSSLQEYRDMPVLPTHIHIKVPSLKSNKTQQGELSTELEEHRVTLTHTSLSSLTADSSSLSVRGIMDKATVVATIATGKESVERVACVNKDEAWIAGKSGNDPYLYCINEDVSITETVNMSDSSARDISVTKQGELIYSDLSRGRIYVVKNRRSELLISPSRCWIPGGLCCTRSGDILVCLVFVKYMYMDRYLWQNKIVCYEGQTVKQEIHKDEHGNQILKNGLNILFVDENINGDICVSDVNADLVVVVGKTGKVLFRYNGESAGMANPFQPQQIVTDCGLEFLQRKIQMATSWAQEVITCDLCIRPTQQFCNTCQVNLCVDCIGKHVDQLSYQSHDIVPFKNRKIQLVFPECELHLNLRCEVHCQKCDVPVCLKCMLGTHNGHIIKDIPENFNDKKKEIEKETQEIESTIIPRYQKENLETESKLSNLKAEYDELEKEAEKQRKFWQQEVDTIFNKFSELIKSKKDNNLAALDSHQSKLKNLLPKMIQTVEQNKEILKTNRISKVANHKSSLKKFKDMPVQPTHTDINVPSLKTNKTPERELSIEIEGYQATLTHTSLSSLTADSSSLSVRGIMDKATVVATIATGKESVEKVECVGKDEAWLADNKESLYCINKDGSVKESVHIFDSLGLGFTARDISVTNQGELIYSDLNFNSGCIYIVKNGRSEVFMSISGIPGGLCCTRSGDILVCLSLMSVVKEFKLEIHYENKIVRYQGQTVKQEIKKDEHGNQILKNGFHTPFVDENINGDICVSDVNANMVVVVGKSGRVRFRYDGTSAGMENPFQPQQIVTDSVGQIIVADNNNACLHILHQNGQFLRCIDNCGLEKPYGLSVDSEGRLWVGLCQSGKVKVIQYMK
ncbi:E3 ubiquitin-protein ligase TRIM71-like, partial [Saccostrea cucullata]|uniref:E3 ubiquitin-protein ligase TRIM71-like n=1 Tax=Saccostrea cuccullata TaxID=36930 RepID=UPI002ED4426B